MCGWVAAPHWGHVVSVVGVAFQFARRERVLERDVFRFGTATSVPLLFVTAGRLGDALQRRPPRVDYFMVVCRILREMGSALGAQSRAVLPAHRLERQGGHHCVPECGLEVDQVAHDFLHLVLVVLGAHLVLIRHDAGLLDAEGPRHRLVLGDDAWDYIRE